MRVDGHGFSEDEQQACGGGRDKKNPSNFKAWSLVAWDSESSSLKTVLTPPCKYGLKINFIIQ